MEEKQPVVVIQGRPINRERTSRADSGSSRLSLGRDRSDRDAASRGNIEGLNLGQRSRNGIGTNSFRRSRSGQYQRASVRSSPQYRTRRRSGVEETTQINSLIKKISISVLIALIVLLLKSIDLPFAQKAVEHVKSAVTDEFDFDEALGKLKFVGDYMPDIKAVFGTAPSEDEKAALVFNAPVKGEVIRLFNENVPIGKGFANQGIDILAQNDADFYASAKGLIAAIEDHEIYGRSVWIEHEKDVFSFYGGCKDIVVKVGQAVKAGEKLGKVVSKNSGEVYLHFEIWDNNEAVDPLTKLREQSKASGREGV